MIEKLKERLEYLNKERNQIMANFNVLVGQIAECENMLKEYQAAEQKVVDDEQVVES